MCFAADVKISTVLCLNKFEQATLLLMSSYFFRIETKSVSRGPYLQEIVISSWAVFKIIPR